MNDYIVLFGFIARIEQRSESVSLVVVCGAPQQHNNEEEKREQ
jgi:hypothetical protein